MEIRRILSPLLLRRLAALFLCGLLLWLLGLPGKETARAVAYAKTLSPSQAADYLMDAQTVPEAYARYRHAADYPARVEKIIRQAASMGSISLFSGSGYAAANRVKTAEAYQALTGIRPVYGIDEPVTALWSKVLLCVSLLGGMLLTVPLTADRENGMWAVLHTARRGRVRLALQKIAALGLLTFLFTGLVYGAALTVGLLRYGGAADLLRPVQSIPMLGDVVFRLSVLSFTALYVLLCWLSVYLVCLTTWFFTAFLRHPAADIACTLVWFALGWALTNWFSFSESAVLLRHGNPWAAMESAAQLADYRNVPLFGQPVAVQTLCVTALLFYLLLFIAGCALTGLQSPGGGIFTYRIPFPSGKRLQTAASVTVARLNGCGKALYTMWIVRRGWLYAVLTVLLLLRWLDLSPAHFSPAAYICREFYDECGMDRHAAETALARMEERLSAAQERYDAAAAAYAAGELDVDTWEAEILRKSGYQNEELALERLQRQRAYLQTQADGNLPYLDESGLTEWLAPFYQHSFSFAQCALLLLLTAGIWQEEKAAGVRCLLRATAHGERRIVRQKIGAVCISAFLVTFLFGFGEMWIIRRLFGLSGFLAPGCAYPALAGIHAPLWCVWIGWLLQRAITLCALSAIVLLVSLLMPVLPAAAICAAAFFAPHILLLLRRETFPILRLSVTEALCLNAAPSKCIFLWLAGAACGIAATYIWTKRRVANGITM